MGGGTAVPPLPPHALAATQFLDFNFMYIINNFLYKYFCLKEAIVGLQDRCCKIGGARSGLQEHGGKIRAARAWRCKS